MGEQFITQNALISILTYGSFLFFVILPGANELTKIDHQKFIKVIEWFIIIEASLGIFQVLAFVVKTGGNFDAATGDVVQGTLNPMSFNNPQMNFNNQTYTLNLLFLLLFYIPFAISSRKKIFIAIMGFVAIVFASVMHLFIAFVVAVAFIGVFFSASFIKINTSRLLIGLFIIAAIIATAIFQPKNFGLISLYMDKFTTNESPKTKATFKAIEDVPKEYPWIYVSGLGPGQYSSRAGLIGTGKYFGPFNHPTELPLLVPGYTSVFGDHVYNDWKNVSLNVAKYGNSTMSRPFYSALSILTEFGYLVFAALLFVVLRNIYKLRKHYIHINLLQNRELSFCTLACAVAILFLIFVSFFENYLEVTQAIFSGLLMLRFFYAYIKDPALSKA
jgi:hypothetical protein